MKSLTLDRISEAITKGFLYLAVVWTLSALSLQVFFIYLNATGQDERTREIVNHLDRKFDGTFKENPENIFYSGPVK